MKRKLKKVKNLGTLTEILGWLKVVVSPIAFYLFSSNEFIKNIADSTFSDFSFNIVLGIIFVILGRRIKKGVFKNNVYEKTKIYIWSILIISGLFGFISFVSGSNSFLILFLFGYSIYTLNKFKKIKVSKEKPEYLISGKKWFLVAGIIIILLGSGILLDLNEFGYFKNVEDFDVPETDKSPEFSEQIGNLYRNTKYNFRIEFPEGWEQSPGDGPHIIRKATNNGSSVTVLVKEFPKELKEFDYKINEISSPESYMQAIKQKFPNAELLDSEYTKIDNKEAFWIKYKAPYETVDISVEGVQEMYQVINNGILYQLGIGAPVDKFDQDKSIMKQSISTFVFENF